MRQQKHEPPPRSYDDWYRSGDSHWEDAPGKAVLIAALTRCCDPDRALSLLDISCGTGSFLERLRHGVDMAQTAIETGQQRYPHLHLTTAVGTVLPAPTSRFDIVTCYGSWEHFAQPQEAIAVVARTLLPGGWCFAMIPTLGIHRTDRDDEGWYEDTEVAGCDARQLQWNLHRDTWAQMFDQAGLFLLDGAFAAGCGAHKPGVFFFGVRTAVGIEAPSPIRRAFLDCQDFAARLAAFLEPGILRAIDLLAQTLDQGGKILVCGNGGSAADAQHFVAELVGRMLCDRRALPAVSLCTDPSVVTAVANDYGYDKTFSRQVEALGRPEDALVAISTSGRSANVIAALEAATALGLRTLALVGPDPGPELETCDVTLSVPANDTQHLQETHIALLRILGEALENRLTMASRNTPAPRGAIDHN